jgi:hypothetical protein
VLVLVLAPPPPRDPTVEEIIRSDAVLETYATCWEGRESPSVRLGARQTSTFAARPAECWWRHRHDSSRGAYEALFDLVSTGKFRFYSRYRFYVELRHNDEVVARSNEVPVALAVDGSRGVPK